MKKSAAFIVAILLIGAVVALVAMRPDNTPSDELPINDNPAAGSMVSPLGMIEGVVMQVQDVDTVNIQETDLVSELFPTETELEAARSQFASMLGYSEEQMVSFWSEMTANGEETTIGDWVVVLTTWYLEPATEDYIDSLGSDRKPMDLPEIGQPEIEALTGVWTWQETVMNNDEVTIPANPADFTLTFGSEGVYGTTDCNNFNGTYSADSIARSMGFGPFAMTRMACEDSQEMEFTSDLGEITNYMITDEGQLVLLFRYDSGSMIFSPVAAE